MNVLKNQTTHETDYISRYSVCSDYYHTLDEKYFTGIGYNLLKTSSYYEHKLKVTDTLENLSLKYYNNPTYWWVIALFNDIEDSYMNLMDKFISIKIPQIAAIEFGDLR